MFWRKRRYIVVLLAFLGYISNYSLRVNISVAIVEMTKNRTVEYPDGTVGYVWIFTIQVTSFPIRILLILGTIF